MKSEVESKSDVNSTFSYDVLGLSILGNTIDLSGVGDVEDYLETFYPYSITFTADKYVLAQNDTVTFEINVVWPFDSSTPLYYKQNEVYSIYCMFCFSRRIYSLQCDLL